MLIKRTFITRSFMGKVGILTTANLFNAILNFISGVLVARWLGPQLYGIAALVMSYPHLVYTFFNVRSGDFSIKYLSEFHVKKEKEKVLAICLLGYGMDFLTAFLTFGIVVITASWAAKTIVHQIEMRQLILLYTIAFLPQSLVSTSYSIFAILEKFSSIAFIQILGGIIKVVLVLGLVWAGWQVAGVIWGNVISMIITGLLYGGMAYRIGKKVWGISWRRGNWRCLKGRTREILSFVLHNDLTVLIGMIPKQLDVVLLGYFRNPLEVGYYKLAKNIANTVGYVVKPLQSVSYPELAKLWGAGEREKFYQRVKELMWKFSFPLGILILMGIFFIPFVLPLIVGNVYQPAVLASQILLVGAGIWLAFFWLRPTYLAQGRMREWCLISMTVVGVSIVTFLIVIPRGGYIGLTVSQAVISGLLGHLMALFLTKRGEN